MTTLWKLDPVHSEITFRVRHMMISNIKGVFKNFDATIESEDENFKKAKVKAVIETNSVSTNSADRDAHLRGEAFFNAEVNPEIIFETDSLNDNITGNLTMKGVTLPVYLTIDFGGMNVDPYGNTKAGFSFEGKLNRSAYGLSWNTPLEGGGLMLSDEVKIAGDLQFIKS